MWESSSSFSFLRQQLSFCPHFNKWYGRPTRAAGYHLLSPRRRADRNLWTLRLWKAHANRCVQKNDHSIRAARRRLDPGQQPRRHTCSSRLERARWNDYHLLYPFHALSSTSSCMETPTSSPETQRFTQQLMRAASATAVSACSTEWRTWRYLATARRHRHARCLAGSAMRSPDRQRSGTGRDLFPRSRRDARAPPG